MGKYDPFITLKLENNNMGLLARRHKTIEGNKAKAAIKRHAQAQSNEIIRPD